MAWHLSRLLILQSLVCHVKCHVCHVTWNILCDIHHMSVLHNSSWVLHTILHVLQRWLNVENRFTTTSLSLIWDMSCIYFCHTMTCLSCFRSRWIHRLDLDYIRIRKLLIDCSKKGILLFTVMSCLMYVMSHAHVMLHVTSHIMYEHDTSLWKKMVEKFFFY